MLSPRQVAVANLLLGAALVVAALLLVRDVIGVTYKDVTVAGKEGKSEVLSVREAVRLLQHYEPVVKDNVFGFPPGSLFPLSTSVTEKPAAGRAESGGELKVIGTVAWTNGFGYAFIAGKQGQELYKTGDYIPGSGRLKLVLADRVVIESGGREVEVGITEIEAQEVSAQARGNGREFARLASEGTYVVDKNAVDESLNNPKRMLTDARLLPNMVNGNQEGFVMSEVRRGGLYHTLGLRNGDVLLRVNDFDISSAEAGLQAFTALKGMDRIRLDLIRNGSRMSLTYIIR